MSDDKSYPTWAGPSSLTTEYNRIQFIIKQYLGLVRTCTVAKVMSVTNTGAVAAVGFIDIMPLVNLVDGKGTAVKHGTIHNIPYFRLQGGSNAVIVDPQIGDLGIVVFADRDISSVKVNKAQANPGSRRRFDWADALYVGGVLNAVPNQYVRFDSAGLHLGDKNGNTIDMTADGIKFTDKFGHVLNMGSTGITAEGTNVHTHEHSGVTTGGGTSGPPV